MFLKKYFISYVYLNKDNSSYGFGYGCTKARRMSIGVLSNYSKWLCDEYDYKSVTIMYFHKIK